MNMVLLPEASENPFAAFRDEQFTNFEDLERGLSINPTFNETLSSFVLDVNGGQPSVFGSETFANFNDFERGGRFGLDMSSFGTGFGEVSTAALMLGLLGDTSEASGGVSEHLDSAAGKGTFDKSKPSYTVVPPDGEGEGDIIVVGSRDFDISIYLNSFGEFDQQLGLLDNLCGWRVLRVWGVPGAVVGAILSSAADWLGSESDIRTAEQKMRDELSKAGGIEKEGTLPDGRKGALGKDGWVYIDRDGNGAFDSRGKQNPDGSYTIDLGTSVTTRSN
jgi:hypothetical protein